MNSFTINDIRAAAPCYDPSRYLGENWFGDALAILHDERIPTYDRIWVVTEVKGALSQREISQFLARIVLPIAKDYTDENGVNVIDTIVKLHERRIAGDEPAGQDWSTARVAAVEAAWAATSSFVEEAMWTATNATMENATRCAVNAAVRAAMQNTTRIDASVKMVEGLIALLENETTNNDHSS